MSLQPCKTCKYFLADTGQCRRHPPQVIVITDVKPAEKEGEMPSVVHNHLGIWPLVDKDNGSCGDHAPNLVIH